MISFYILKQQADAIDAILAIAKVNSADVTLQMNSLLQKSLTLFF